MYFTAALGLQGYGGGSVGFWCLMYQKQSGAFSGSLAFDKQALWGVSRRLYKVHLYGFTGVECSLVL